MPEEQNSHSQQSEQFQPQSPDLQPKSDNDEVSREDGHSSSLENRESALPRDEEASLSQRPSYELSDHHDYKNAHAVDAGAATELPTSYLDARDNLKHLQNYTHSIGGNSDGSPVADNAQPGDSETIHETLEENNWEIQKYQSSLREIKNWAVILQEARAKNIELPKEYSSTEKCFREERLLNNTGKSIKGIKMGLAAVEGALDSRDSSGVSNGVRRIEECMRYVEEYRYSRNRSIDHLASNLANEFDLGISIDELQEMNTDDFVTRAEYLATVCQVINRGLDIKQALNDQRKTEFEEFKRSIGFVEPERKSSAVEHTDKSQA